MEKLHAPFRKVTPEQQQTSEYEATGARVYLVLETHVRHVPHGIRVKYSPRIFVIADSSEIPERFPRTKHEPEKFTDRIIFMSMFNDINWTRKGNDGICISISEEVQEYAKRFSQEHWTFLAVIQYSRVSALRVVEP